MVHIKKKFFLKRSFFPPISSSSNCTVSDLIFNSLNHFELIFVYNVRYGYNFFLMLVNIQFCTNLLKRGSFPHCIFPELLSKIN